MIWEEFRHSDPELAALGSDLGMGNTQIRLEPDGLSEGWNGG